MRTQADQAQGYSRRGHERHERRSDAEQSNGVGRSMLDELMTSREVAIALQMKLSTVEDYARRGVLPSVKLGRHRRFIRSQLERTVSELSEQA